MNASENTSNALSLFEQNPEQFLSVRNSELQMAIAGEKEVDGKIQAVVKEIIFQQGILLNQAHEIKDLKKAKEIGIKVVSELQEKSIEQEKELKETKEELAETKEDAIKTNEKVEKISTENEEMSKRLKSIDDFNQTIKDTAVIAGKAVAVVAGAGAVVAAGFVHPALGIAAGLSAVVTGQGVCFVIEEAEFLKASVDICKKLLPEASEEQLKKLCTEIDDKARTVVGSTGGDDDFDIAYYDYGLGYGKLRCEIYFQIGTIPGLNEENLKEIIEKIKEISPRNQTRPNLNKNNYSNSNASRFGGRHRI